MRNEPTGTAAKAAQTNRNGGARPAGPRTAVAGAALLAEKESTMLAKAIDPPRIAESQEKLSDVLPFLSTTTLCAISYDLLAAANRKPQTLEDFNARRSLRAIAHQFNAHATRRNLRGR
jgi:hypothetical protein